MANKDNTYTVDNFVIELDTDDKEADDREYIEYITATIMTICNDFIKRHPNINLCSSQGLTELLKDIRRKYKADKDNIKELNILWDIYTVICCTLFGSLGNILPDELMKSLASKDSDVQSQAVQLLSQIPSASDQERDTIIENLNNLGIDGAESLEKGIEDQIESTSTMSKNLVTAVSSAATDEFTSTTSGAMYDAGANASKGFWQGIKDWWDDSWMGRKINELKNAVAGRDGLDEHSPSKIMGQYGAFAGIGFNREFQTEMDKTVPMVERWMENIKAVYSGYSIAFPGSDVSYSFNTDFIDRFDNFPKVSVPDFGASSMSVNYTSDITASLKGSNEELLYELKRNNDLLEQILEKPSIDDDGIYRATQRGVAKNFYRTGKTGLKGVD